MTDPLAVGAMQGSESCTRVHSIRSARLHFILLSCHLQVVAVKAEVSKLKEELAPVYKDKARLTEELMQCRESLTRVRDTNALQDKSLNEATGRIRDLKSRNKELSQQVDAERATQALAATELEV